ncbi:hypothetical protein J4418_04175 [Candidatus Woesearchaeota archaeon]|nr:hypothetical protein [Candidatus Woesearchaeota archaeon]
MDKKSQTEANPIRFLLGSILIIIIAFIIISFQFNLFDILKSASTDNACKSSVVLNSVAKLSGNEFMDEIKCPTRDIKISDEKKVFPTVANELYNCWDNFGKGKLDLFKKEKGMYCVICSRIEFTDLEGKKPGLFSYLYKTKLLNQDKTYYDALFDVNFDTITDAAVEELIQTHINKNDNLDLSKPLGIMFLYDKTDINIGKGESTFWGATTGFLAGVGTNAYLVSIGGVSFLGFTVVPTLVLGSGAIITGASLGTYIGYLFGHESSSEWRAGVVTMPLEQANIDKLGCVNLPVGGKEIEIIVS